MRRLTAWAFGLLAVCAAAAYVATIPRGLPAATLASWPAGNPARGETWFWAGGCDSCHAAANAEGDARLQLGGGQVLATDFGDFTVPNISPDPADGIGAWSATDFANAMLRGVSPDGSHLYPAFPYTSYTRMQPQDVADLWAYLGTLPPVAGRPPGHGLRFPFNVRRGVGLWKLAFLSDAPAVTVDTFDPELARGQYLVEGPGHCGECHTPRNFAGALDTSRWLAGAPSPEGKGQVPNITTGGGGVGDWTAEDLVYMFESGFKPDFDTVGGAMVAVQENLSMLAADDLQAIAAYLKAVPPQASSR